MTSDPTPDPPECDREKWCDMPGGHSGECRSAMDVPTPDRHREARALDLADELDEHLALYDLPAKEPYLLPAFVVNAIPSLTAALRQSLSPAGPEERREYQSCERTHATGTTHYHPLRVKHLIDAYEDRATPAPDTGAEERLRAALDEAWTAAEVAAAGRRLMVFRSAGDDPEKAYCAKLTLTGRAEGYYYGPTTAAALQSLTRALSGGSVDEERDSDES